MTPEERRTAVAQARADRVDAVGVTWEERMSAQAATRAARVPEPEWVDPHEGHHIHVGSNWKDCVDCGTGLGVWSVAFPEPDSEEERQFFEWKESLSCSRCGERGVESDEDFRARVGRERV